MTEQASRPLLVPSAVTDPVPDPLGPIARHLATSPPDDRTFARRRLASLAGLLALVLAVASFVGADGDDDVVDVRTDVAASADGEVAEAADLGTPAAVRALLSETTTTLVEATGATTSTTPTTEAAAAATSPSPSTSAVTEEETEDEDTVGSTTTTTEATRPRALHTGPAESTTTEAPATTTTTAPRRATTTTTAPKPATTTTTTTTTAPQPASTDSGSGGYAYDDPRSTQVWYDLADCESGGRWSIDTGNGYYGGLQFSLASWESVGGSGYPNEHPAATQIDFGRKLQARQGWGAWPHCSQELGLR